LLALNKNAALHVHGAKRRSFVFTGGGGEPWSSGMQDATVPYTVLPSATKMGTSLTILSLSPLAPPTLGKAAVITFAKTDSTLRIVRAVPPPKNDWGRGRKRSGAFDTVCPSATKRGTGQSYHLFCVWLHNTWQSRRNGTLVKHSVLLASSALDAPRTASVV
jgi:hypothetical protein